MYIAFRDHPLRYYRSNKLATQCGLVWIHNPLRAYTSSVYTKIGSCVQQI